jgi:transcriptional regulator of met regulon
MKSFEIDWAEFFEISAQIKKYTCDRHEERISKLRNLREKTNRKEQACDHHLNAFSKDSVEEWRDLRNEDKMICTINCDR